MIIVLVRVAITKTFTYSIVGKISAVMFLSWVF